MNEKRYFGLGGSRHRLAHGGPGWLRHVDSAVSSWPKNTLVRLKSGLACVASFDESPDF